MYPILLAALFPFFFIGMWVFVTFVLSRMGWARLVVRYATIAPFTGERIGIVSASINNVKYKNSLVLKCGPDGIYLIPVVLFRLFHPPILIPWNEIKEIKTTKFLFRSTTRLILGMPKEAEISLRAGTFSKMGNYLPMALR